jgi:hypothetical protein
VGQERPGPSYFFISVVLGPLKQPRMVRTFLKVYMELGSSFLFLQEQIQDIIIVDVLYLLYFSVLTCEGRCVVRGVSTM